MTRLRPLGLATGIAMAILLSGSVVLAAPTDSSSPAEHKIRAAFIHNFLKFVTWPSSAFADDDAPLILGVLGDDTFCRYLQGAFKDQSIRGRLIRFRMIRDPKSTRGCHVLYVAGRDAAERRRLFDLLEDAPILSIGNADGFCKDGGILNFVHRNKRLRFEANHSAAKWARLILDVKMLKLAILVEE